MLWLLAVTGVGQSCWGVNQADLWKFIAYLKQGFSFLQPSYNPQSQCKETLILLPAELSERGIEETPGNRRQLKRKNMKVWKAENGHSQASNPSQAAVGFSQEGDLNQHCAE